MTTPERGDQLLQAIARVNRWATRHADLEIPPAQARLLGLVSEIGPARIGDLAAADHCSQPTMTTQVQRVEASGWLERSADDSDARASLVAITREGRAVLARVRAARSAVVRPALADLSDGEAKTLDEAITIMMRLTGAGD